MEPVRCFTCNKVLGGKYEQYRSLCQTQSSELAMNQLGLRRWCCRRMMLTSTNLTERTLDYNQVHDTMKQNPYVVYKTDTVGPNALRPPSATLLQQPHPHPSDKTQRVYWAR